MLTAEVNVVCGRTLILTPEPNAFRTVGCFQRQASTLLHASRTTSQMTDGKPPRR
jgi:hypothetical protein